MSTRSNFAIIITVTFFITFSAIADRGIIGIQYIIQNGYPIIKQVTPGYPAAKAGIKAGDWILSIDGYSLRGLSLNAVYNRIGGNVNQKSSMIISRNGQRYTVLVTRVPPPLSSAKPTIPKGYFGFNFVMQSGYPLIKRITPGYPAARAGMLPGDWLMSIDGRSLKGQTFNSASSMMSGSTGRTSNFIISRNGQQFTVSMTRVAATSTIRTPKLPSPDTASPPTRPRKPYIPPVTYPTYSSDTRLGTLGFKYEIGKRYPVIQQVIARKPAAVAGLRRGDKIISIDRRNMFGQKRKQVIQTLKGRVGQISLFTIMRKGKQFQVKLKRVPKAK